MTRPPDDTFTRYSPGGGEPSAPLEEQLFSPGALDMIKNSPHRNAENYVRSMGYKDLEDYAERTKVEEESNG